MDSEKKMTRKDFVRRSGLLATGGVSLVSSFIFGRRKSHSEKKATSSESFAAMSRIRPNREAVVRKSV